MFLLVGIREIFPKIRHFYITVGDDVREGIGDVGKGIGLRPIAPLGFHSHQLNVNTPLVEV